jgi:hypothetical protein
MAIYNEILTARFSNLVRKLFALKGGRVGPTSIGGEILPVLPFDYGAELRALENWALFASIANMAAPGAGNRTGFAIRNPAGSGMVSVVTMILYANIVATIDGPFVTYQTTSTDLNVAAGPPRSLDKRIPQSSSMIMSQQNNATGDAATILQAQMTGNTSFHFLIDGRHEIPLLPGDRIATYSGVLNQGSQISYCWRERLLEESERQ